MSRFKAKLVSGTKAPYKTWTFVVIPGDLAKELGPKGSVPVRGTVAGIDFRATVTTGEGVRRFPVPRTLLEQASVQRGDVVAVALEPDPEPRSVEVPEELSEVLAADTELGRLFEALPPAHRRAWASYVAGAKRPETRLRRAQKAPAGIRAKAFPA